MREDELKALQGNQQGKNKTMARMDNESILSYITHLKSKYMLSHFICMSSRPSHTVAGHRVNKEYVMVWLLLVSFFTTKTISSHMLQRTDATIGALTFCLSGLVPVDGIGVICVFRLLEKLYFLTLNSINEPCKPLLLKRSPLNYSCTIKYEKVNAN